MLRAMLFWTGVGLCLLALAFPEWRTTVRIPGNPWAMPSSRGFLLTGPPRPDYTIREYDQFAVCEIDVGTTAATAAPGAVLALAALAVPFLKSRQQDAP